MRKKLVLFVFFFIICSIAYAQNSKHRIIELTKLTKEEKLTDLIESPNAKWIVFVKKSNYTIPRNCFYFFSKGDHADEIWLINNKKMTKKLLVSPQFNCKDVTKMIFDPHNLQFSPDSKTLYFETSAWVTSGAIHAIDINGKNLRFVTDGSELRIVQSGKNKGNLIVNQHRYRFKNDIPLGSYDGDWLYTPLGKEIKYYDTSND
jgi:hypothetical protein